MAVLQCRTHSGCMRCYYRPRRRTRSRMARTPSDLLEPARDRACTCSLESRSPPGYSCWCCGDTARTPDLCFRGRKSHARRTHTRHRRFVHGLQRTCSRSGSRTPGPISRRVDRESAARTPADSMRALDTANTSSARLFRRLLSCACETFLLGTGDIHPRRGFRSRGCTHTARWPESPCGSPCWNRGGTTDTRGPPAMAGTCRWDRRCTFAQGARRGRSLLGISNRSRSLQQGAHSRVGRCSRLR